MEPKLYLGCELEDNLGTLQASGSMESLYCGLGPDAAHKTHHVSYRQDFVARFQKLVYI